MAAEILYEKLGVFYLGKRYDLESGQRLPEPVLYDSKDLVTHAVCVGMTGSGKTGLGISIIEEAAIDGIPVLAIDPKGDLANLLLDAPADAADRWRAGLAEWDQDEGRIARMRAAADFRVYTPGSRAGTPLALLRSLAPPAGADEEAMALRATATAASLLALAGITESRAHSPEQVLLATLLTHAWGSDRGQNGVGSGSDPSLDLATLIQQIQRPPIDKVGVLDMETFFPARERQELALRLNGVLAAPGFDVWLAGEPLDVGALLFTPEGKPRIAIVSIAHLGDAERMMLVTLLLNAVLEWTRRQTGTGSLRALLYMDEVFGYLPPSANPPSKLPLLTLLKQARAFGVGIMLSTQNPVDLDYKALSNTGTWFLGKLQTERDKARVLDGLGGAGGGVDRQQLDRQLSALPGRVFLLHNVHEPAPVLFQTRWVLSFLKGPMSLEEIRSLRPSDTKAQGAKPQSQSPTDVAAGLQARPVLPAGVTEFFLPGDGDVYEPVLYGAARVHYVDTKRGVDVVNDIHAMTPIESGPVAVDWEQGMMAGVAPSELLSAPSHPRTFAPLAPAALSARNYSAWSGDFERWVARTQSLKLFNAPAFKLSSAPGESEGQFQARVQLATREQRDAAVEKLRARFAPKIARLEEKHRRAAESIAKEQQQAGQQKLQTAVSIGATLLGALMGRKAVSASTLGRATTTVRGVSRSSKEAGDVARAEARAGEVETELKELQAEAEAEVAALTAEMSAAPEILTIEIKPQRGRVDLQLVTLAWRPR